LTLIGGLVGGLDAPSINLYIGVLIGILFGVICGVLFSVLNSGPSEVMPDMLRITVPNQEIRQSGRDSLFIVLASLIFCLLFALVNNTHGSLKFRGNVKNRPPAESRRQEIPPEALKFAVEEQKEA